MQTMDGWPGAVRVAGWERFPWLRAGFSTRLGGESSAYGAGELNMGWTAEDESTVVAENRSRFVEAVAGAEFELVTVRQVHGAVVQPVERGKVELATDAGKALLVGDGLITRERGLMVGVQTADCVPVLVVDTRLRAVAAIHAGWRGTAARIVEAGIVGMAREFGSRVEDLMAAVGPSIGACCFEVGDEVAAAFETGLVTQVNGRAHVDLWEANRRQLVEAGLGAEAVTVVGECTVCEFVEGRRKYFSHRAEKGVTGRMLSCIGLMR